MLIWKKGNTFETIGGGEGEAKVIEQAIAVLEFGKKQFVEIDLSGASGRETQGICGGWMQIWLERWSSHELPFVKVILDRLQSGQSVTLATPFDADRSPHLLDDPLLNNQCDRAFVETLQPSPMLLIVGAGHVGEQLAKIANLAGFQILVQDDRPAWANAQRYPQAAQIFAESIEAAIDRLADYSQLYAALVTRGYQHDLAALNLLISRQKPCCYIGMIGSKKRVKQVIQAIEKSGADAAKLRSIYAPIGLDIGALTPEEIAVSIVAELILVRRGGTGRSLSHRLGLSE